MLKNQKLILMIQVNLLKKKLLLKNLQRIKKLISLNQQKIIYLEITQNQIQPKVLIFLETNPKLKLKQHRQQKKHQVPIYLEIQIQLIKNLLLIRPKIIYLEHQIKLILIKEPIYLVIPIQIQIRLKILQKLIKHLRIKKKI